MLWSTSSLMQERAELLAEQAAALDTLLQERAELELKFVDECHARYRVQKLCCNAEQVRHGMHPARQLDDPHLPQALSLCVGSMETSLSWSCSGEEWGLPMHYKPTSWSILTMCSVSCLGLPTAVG